MKLVHGFISKPPTEGTNSRTGCSLIVFEAIDPDGNYHTFFRPGTDQYLLELAEADQILFGLDSKGKPHLIDNPSAIGDLKVDDLNLFDRKVVVEQIAEEIIDRYESAQTPFPVPF